MKTGIHSGLTYREWLRRSGTVTTTNRAKLEKLRAAIELAYLQIYYPDEAPAPEEI